jgi:DNA-directed RNA polymerase delta subunit
MEKKMLEKMGEKVKFTEIMKKIKIILNKKDLKKYISNFYWFIFFIFVHNIFMNMIINLS